MADCDNDRECEEITPGEITPKPLPKQCSGGDESGGTNDFNELDNRPKYDGAEMTGSTNIPNLSTEVEQLGTNINNIQNLIPEEATAENQLADKQYVDAHGGSITPVQSIGTSQTDVMSQWATSKMIYPRIGDQYHDIIGIRGDNETPDAQTGMMSVGLGSSHISRGANGVAIGFGATVYAAGEYSIAIGNTAKANGNTRAVALGNAAEAAKPNSIAIGTNAKTTREGEVNVGADTSGRGYNNTNYRVIGGVHDGQDAHDVATVGQITSLTNSGAPTTATEGFLGKTYIDTDTDTAYMCTKVDNGSYTWKQITA